MAEDRRKLKISRNQTRVKGLFVKISHIDAFFANLVIFLDIQQKSH